MKRLCERIFRRISAAIFAAVAGASFVAAADVAPAVYDVEIVRAYPHDPQAFTQGLFFRDGFLYESTGHKGRSSIRRVNLETGEVLQRRDFPPDLFGEGIAPWKDGIVSLTWRSQTGFVFDRKSFKQKKRFTYPGEGWGLTEDGARLIMSDGTADLRFLHPQTLKETGRISVTHGGRMLDRLNELEWIDGEVFANVWLTDVIVRIDPSTGAVIGVIDARPLRAALGDDAAAADVLNGIAFDRAGGRLFVTGKYWPRLFEIRLVERPRPAGPQPD